MIILAAIEPPSRNFGTRFPHLFHDPLDNKPLPACLLASEASSMLNKAEGLWRWLMPGGIA
jgi:hypothetical protein